jgi:prolyl oligopeptidase
MKKYFAFGLSFAFSIVCFSQQFPVSKKVPAPYVKHGISIQDDYSWLESMTSQEVIDWRNAQNALTNAHLDTIKKTWSAVSKIKEYGT